MNIYKISDVYDFNTGGEAITVRFQEMMVIGGGGNGQGPLNPFDAVGLKSFIDISKQLATTEQ